MSDENTTQHEKIATEPIKPDQLRNIGWSAAFLFFPFGNSTLGMFLLLSAKMRDWLRGTKYTVIQEKPLSVKIFQILFMCFYGTAVLSAFFSPKQDIAFLSNLGLFLITSIFISEGFYLGFTQTIQIKEYLGILMGASIVAAFIAILRFYSMHLSRVVTLFASYNFYGTIIILSSGPILGYFYPKGKKWRFWLAAYFLVVIPALILTISRGAWVGFVIMLFCFMLFNRKTIHIFLIILLIVGMMFLAYHPLMHRFSSIFHSEKNISRIYIWQSSLKIFHTHPILGVGAGVYPFVFDQYAMPGSWERHVSHAHSLFLHVADEFGIIGLIIFLSLIAIVLYQGFYLARLGNPFYQGLFASLVGVLIHLQVDVTIWNIDVGGGFWILVGLIAGSFCYERSRQIRGHSAPSFG